MSRRKSKKKSPKKEQKRNKARKPRLVRQKLRQPRHPKSRKKVRFLRGGPKARIISVTSKKKIQGKDRKPLAKKSKVIKKQTERIAEDLHRVKIRVIGIGGGGGSVVAEIAPKVPKAGFVAANTDMQALKKISGRCRQFAFGQEHTRGLGAGADPRVGQIAASQAKEKIAKLFQGADFCILISCLGGGTGTGSVTTFAQAAKEQGCFTLGVFTLPFRFEGDKKMAIARQALAKTMPLLNASVVFPNERIFQILDGQTGFQAALSSVNEILAQDLKNLMEMISLPGLVNIDFADIRAVLQGEGKSAYLASAVSQGEGNIEAVCRELLHHPLNEYNLLGVDRIVFHLSSDRNLSLSEIKYASSAISELNPKAKIIFGVSQRSLPRHTITITLLATGIPLAPEKKEGRPRQTRRQTPRPMRRQKRQSKEKAPSRESGADDSRKRDIVRFPSGKKREEMNDKNQESAVVLRSGKGDKRQQSTSNASKKSASEAEAKKPRQSLQAETEIPTGAQEDLPHKPKPRKNALDIKREIEKADSELAEEEKKWDIPAFLRRKT